MKPGTKYSDAYTLSELKGGEVLILRSDDTYDRDAMVALDAKMRSESPKWTGMMLVLRTDQAIEKMPEAMARDLYQALKKVFTCPTCGSDTCEGTHKKEASGLVGADGVAL